MNRVVFLNRFYWPEEPATAQLLTDLAEGLAAGGRPVLVLTSPPAAAPRATRETHRGVNIRRVRCPRLGGRGALARAFDWAAFGLGALWRVGRDVGRGDTLVLLTDPPLLAALAAPLARLRGARVVHWVQDIYPELPLALGARGLGWLRLPRDRAWRRADAAVVLGADMAALLRARGVTEARIHISPNWAPAGLAPASAAAVSARHAAWGVADRFVVAYSGNLGRVHDLDPVLELAAALRTDPGFVFLFIGDGAQRPRLEALAASRGLDNVRFLPHQPRDQLAASLGAADVHLVTLRAGCEQLVFPSKLYGIAAAARPVLFLGPPACEFARQVEAGGFGRAFARDAIGPMAQTLRAWREDPAGLAALGQAAAAFDVANGRAGRAVRDWQGLLAGLGTVD